MVHKCVEWVSSKRLWSWLLIELLIFATQWLSVVSHIVFVLDNFTLTLSLPLSTTCQYLFHIKVQQTMTYSPLLGKPIVNFESHENWKFCEIIYNFYRLYKSRRLPLAFWLGGDGENMFICLLTARAWRNPRTSKNNENECIQYLQSNSIMDIMKF